MSKDIDFFKIERKWQKKWEEKKVFSAKEGKKNKYYVLEMFPYPSADYLHMGHVRNYAIGDLIARYKRMKGFNVLYPMGFDAFGLPAENASIKEKIHPKKYTEHAIKTIKRLMKELGLSYDWEREVVTCYPEYYKWNQWIFLQMLKKGIAYRKKAPVNWCPKCNTVLANEEVIDGKCWRCESEVIIEHLEQWFLRITDYADELLQGLEKIEWPERVKEMQRNWIGKSEGTKIIFQIENSEKKIEVFTTRADTLFGVTFLVYSAQHSDVKEIVFGIEYEQDYNKFRKKVSASQKLDLSKDKEGFFTGKYAFHPLTGERIPIYSANFIVADYGTGAVMGVPGHDQRDFEFAKKYKIPIKAVVQPKDRSLHEKEMKEAYTGSGFLVNSGEFNGVDNESGKRMISEALSSKGKGGKSCEYRLRDWLISRQRYWGTPIPIVYCEFCKKEIEKNALEISFYNQEVFENLANGSKTIETRALNPDEKERNFSKVKVGDSIKCINKVNNNIIYLEVLSRRIYKSLSELLEDKRALSKIFPGKTIDSIKDLEILYSYIKDYLRRIEKNGLVVWDVCLVIPGIIPVPEKELPLKLPEKVKFTGKGNPLKTNKEFVNTNCPACGGNARRETDTMATFFDSSWYFLRYLDNKNDKKIFDKKKVDYWMPVEQYIGGIEHAVLHLLYARFFTKFLRDLKLIDIDEPFIRLFNHGIVHKDGKRMSKSNGKAVTAEEISKKYGIDSARLFLMFVAAPDKNIEWDEHGIEGAFRVTNRLMKLAEKVGGKNDVLMEHKLNFTLRALEKGYEDFEFNKGLVKFMEFVNYLSDKKEIPKEVLASLTLAISPVMPHVAEEIWSKIGGKGLVAEQKWKGYDASKINEKIEIAEKAVEKTIDDIFNVLKLVKEKKNKEAEKVYLYVLPNEKEHYEADALSKRIGKRVIAFAVNDKNKYDPENKSVKAKPGKPGIFVE